MAIAVGRMIRLLQMSKEKKFWAWGVFALRLP